MIIEGRSEAYKKWILAKKYIKSLFFGAFIKDHQFSDLKYFCLFIGHPRSGSSLVASLLDAHPSACIGMEVNVLNLIKHDFSKKQVFYSLLSSSKNYKQILKNEWTGFSYYVPEQYQGVFNNLKIIGDKKADISTKLIGNDFSLYSKLVRIIDIPIKIIHVIRNPYDNISTMILRNTPENVQPTIEDFQTKIEHYFKNVQINSNLQNREEFDILKIYHENFISNPSRNIECILNFLGLESTKNFIEKCVSIVYKKPHKSRYDIIWSENLKQEVQQRIDSYPFLSNYSFNS